MEEAKGGRGAVDLSDVTVSFWLSDRRTYTAIAGASLRLASRLNRAALKLLRRRPWES